MKMTPGERAAQLPITGRILDIREAFVHAIREAEEEARTEERLRCVKSCEEVVFDATRSVFAGDRLLLPGATLCAERLRLHVERSSKSPPVPSTDVEAKLAGARGNIAMHETAIHGLEARVAEMERDRSTSTGIVAEMEERIASLEARPVAHVNLIGGGGISFTARGGTAGGGPGGSATFGATGGRGSAP